MHGIPDIAFTVGNFLYAPSFVEQSLSLTGRSRNDLANFASLYEDCQLIDERIVLVSSKRVFEHFECEFGEIVRSRSYDDVRCPSGSVPHTRVGGCPIRCFPSLRGREITFLHLYHENCAASSPEENFKIETKCKDMPVFGKIIVTPSKSRKFPNNTIAQTFSTHDSNYEGKADVKVVACATRKLTFQYHANSLTDSGFYRMICDIADWCWSIVPISLMEFQCN